MVSPEEQFLVELCRLSLFFFDEVETVCSIEGVQFVHYVLIYQKDFMLFVMSGAAY